MYFDTGSARVIRPSSTRIIAATLTIGLVIEAMRKMVSVVIGALAVVAGQLQWIAQDAVLRPADSPAYDALLWVTTRLLPNLQQFNIGDALVLSSAGVPAEAVLAVAGAATFERFHLALMRAYFAENRTISDREVILDVAAAIAAAAYGATSPAAWKIPPSSGPAISAPCHVTDDSAIVRGSARCVTAAASIGEKAGEANARDAPRPAAKTYSGQARGSPSAPRARPSASQAAGCTRFSATAASRLWAAPLASPSAICTRLCAWTSPSPEVSMGR